MALWALCLTMCATPATRPAMRATRAVATSAALGSLLQGYHTGVVGGALLHIVPDLGLDAKPAVVGLIVTAATVGSVLGTASAAPLSDAVGRRTTLRLASLLFVVAAALLAWSPSIHVLVGARMLAGLAIGNAGAAVPVYIAEVADSEQRGALATIPQLFISSGILLSYVVCLALGILLGGRPWRAMLGVSVLPALLFAACMIALPESPRWLASRGRADEARAALARLRGVHAGQTRLIEAEYKELERSLPRRPAVLGGATAAAVTPATPRRGLLSLLSTPRLRRTLGVVAVLQALQQFSGINAIVYFTPQTLRAAGVARLFAPLGIDDDAASLAATALAYLPRIPTMFATMALMDTYGRRSLLLAFMPVMGASLLALALAGPSSPLLAVAATCAYGCAFSLSLGPIPNIMTAELFPMHARAAAMTASLAVQFVSNTLVGFCFPPLRAAMGTRTVLCGFAAVCILGTTFAWRCVPETRRTKLE